MRDVRILLMAVRRFVMRTRFRDETWLAMGV
jgi:hypothetical protein